ncbi:hypothetical protein [Rheinheimera sp.]|uniref:hypothetical protein n=1 Tax=Rheinheimera sp. TaxID=1869214 RepID=UPI003D2E1BB9
MQNSRSHPCQQQGLPLGAGAGGFTGTAVADNSADKGAPKSSASAKLTHSAEP